MHHNLASLTTQVYQKALSKGAVIPIATQSFHLVQNSIQFLVRVLTEAQEKKKASNQVGNPFLPYDPNLYVVDLTETHVCLLNKFCVVPLHILLVTKFFEPQNILTERDFEAASVVLSQWNGVCFYNSCKVAGASQQHKHLQFIPYIDMNSDPSIVVTDNVVPFDHLLGNCVDQKVDAFPFVHLVVSLQDLDWSNAEEDIHQKSKYLARTYYSLLNQLSSQLEHFPDEYGTVGMPSKEERRRQESNPFPYNLIFTREWMYIVPRSLDEWQGIAVNALGMVGTLLVKNQESWSHLKSVGPLELLKKVGFPRP
ncbi:hypothetical protein GpartN1_g7353.t1 [Galdieria partita]|uniref:Phosphorylase n=1 Tax=Galdieria partita TaxID=83374 RepID=A0A9C7UUF7_9RHOD|nr:hypothetical protein GpartN1_g7353.t1 [Galdieria partita]